MTEDAVVVGAGVIGCSIAYELARSGRRVTVVDKGDGPGRGSTSASSAIVRFSYSTRDAVALAWESFHCWSAWGDHVGSGVRPLARYHRTGMVMLDVPVVPLGRLLPLYDEVGVDYETWTPDELERRVPGIDTGAHWPNKSVTDPAFWAEPGGRLGAVFTPDAGFVDDPQLAAANLAAAAQRAGAEFSFRRRVTEVLRSNGAVQGIRLDDGAALESRVVVNAAGPWSGALNQLAGVGGTWSVGVRPLRQEVHVVPAPPGFNGEEPGPVLADLDLGTYMRGTAGDGLLVGGTEPECDELLWVEDPDEVSPAPTTRVYEAQLTRAARRLTGLGVPGRPRGVVGVYDVTPDWTPIYDKTELAGYYVAIGTSGNQFKNAPVVGSLMRALIDGVEAGHDHDAEPVHVDLPHTGFDLNVGAFSRARRPNDDTSGTVLG